MATWLLMGSLLLGCQDKCSKYLEQVQETCPPGTYATIFYKDDASGSANGTYGGAQVKVQGYGKTSEQCDVWCVYPYGGGGTGSYGYYGSGYYTTSAADTAAEPPASTPDEPAAP